MTEKRVILPPTTEEINGVIEAIDQAIDTANKAGSEYVSIPYPPRTREVIRVGINLAKLMDSALHGSDN